MAPPLVRVGCRTLRPPLVIWLRLQSGRHPEPTHDCRLSNYSRYAYFRPVPNYGASRGHTHTTPGTYIRYPGDIHTPYQTPHSPALWETPLRWITPPSVALCNAGSVWPVTYTGLLAPARACACVMYSHPVVLPRVLPESKKLHCKSLSSIHVYYNHDPVRQKLSLLSCWPMHAIGNFSTARSSTCV